MWSIFSRDPAKDFLFEIGAQVEGTGNSSLWTLHDGKKKGTGEQVSVFSFSLKDASDTQAQIMKAAFKRYKTLRHPSFLTFLDGLETDKVLYVATEYVQPLSVYLASSKKEKEKNTSVTWGLHQIAKGLSFMIEDCSLTHNAVCSHSVYVDRAGEWKLGGLEFIANVQDPAPIKILPELEKYDPPERCSPGAARQGHKWSADVWGLGCLIWEVFNGTLPQTTSLKTVGKIPKPLVPLYCELVGANPKSRPSPSAFIEKAKARGSFMDTKFVETMLFLEEIQIKDQSEKTAFLCTLTPVLDDFPRDCCKFRILPQIISAFEFGGAGSAVLTPLLKLSGLMEPAEYQKKLVPCLVKLFSSPDRQTRVRLLQQIDDFAENLPSETVNKEIFLHVCQGFLDTNPLVRESTIKAMVSLAPKLNHKNLNEELMRHMARLQAKDDQGGIRTNTTVCLGKIAPFLDPKLRQKMLCSAFLRAIKDPFPAARQAGVLAIAATHHLFPLKELGSKLLPPLCFLCMDPEKQTRDQTFKVIKMFISKLEKVSESPELAAEMEKNVDSGQSSAVGSGSWAGWAAGGMSALTSRLVRKSAKPTTQQQGASDPVAKSAPRSTSETSVATNTTSATPTTLPRATEETPNSAESGWEESGWDDETPAFQDVEADPSMTSAASDGWAQDEGWEDNDAWGSLDDSEQATADTNEAEFVSTANSGLSSAGEYNWGTSSDNFFSSITDNKPEVKAAPQPDGWEDGWGASNDWSATSKRSTQRKSTGKMESEGDSGWGDLGWNADPAPVTDDADSKRREREEKRIARQKQLEEKRKQRTGGGGAMKLGKKLT